MKAKVFDIWEVAAALLLPERLGTLPLGMDYKEITRIVMQTGLTKLGINGSTPSQTMGYLLRKANYGGMNVFESIIRGLYRLRDKEWTRTLPPVRAVLDHLTQQDAYRAELDKRDAQIRHLRVTIREQNAKLKQIVSLCSTSSRIIHQPLTVDSPRSSAGRQA